MNLKSFWFKYSKSNSLPHDNKALDAKHVFFLERRVHVWCTTLWSHFCHIRKKNYVFVNHNYNIKSQNYDILSHNYEIIQNNEKAEILRYVKLLSVIMTFSHNFGSHNCNVLSHNYDSILQFCQTFDFFVSYVMLDFLNDFCFYYFYVFMTIMFWLVIILTSYNFKFCHKYEFNLIILSFYDILSNSYDLVCHNFKFYVKLSTLFMSVIFFMLKLFVWFFMLLMAQLNDKILYLNVELS